MKVEQYVMAYGVEQDRLRALLPDGFTSLRPVLRINAEIRDGLTGYIELNTAVERNGTRGWLNISQFENVRFAYDGMSVKFSTDNLRITFTRTGISGSCPAEKDNEGCFFVSEDIRIRKPEVILSNKEFCDCSFGWTFSETSARGESIGKTLPAYPTEAVKVYPRMELTAENAAEIPCRQVLGAYTVSFER